VLIALSETPERGLRVLDLAQQLGWERSRLSHHVERMSRHGLVVREASPSDRRVTVVMITETGRQVIEPASRRHAELIRVLVFDQLSREQIGFLTKVTGLLLAGLEEGARIREN
jgi:DNA-binding MarR family transcriptional regulator